MSSYRRRVEDCHACWVPECECECATCMAARRKRAVLAAPPVVAQEEDRDVGLVEERRQFNVRIQELETALAQVQQIVQGMDFGFTNRTLADWAIMLRAALPKE